MTYADEGLSLLPAGTPVKITGFGRQRVHLQIDGKPIDLGNDYSRTLDLPTFAARYVVVDDPTRELMQADPETAAAVRGGKLRPGMTKAQVVMALGYPVSSENPSFDAPRWRYWVSSERGYTVVFDAQGKLLQLEGEPDVVAFVMPEPGSPLNVTFREKPEAPCALNVYRTRTRDAMPVARRSTLVVDGKEMGLVAFGETRCLDLPPGPHTVVMQDTVLGVSTPERKMEVTLVAGKPSFVRSGIVFNGVRAVGKQVVPETMNVLEQAVEWQWRGRQ
ncbi:outer membrane protein assembly factor BamE domain-containing protein [Ideonella sp. BN130291]|uniref:outer membrane protein assembly factor BamE domain-containing protein n=1 Tax=Ideonella sp. BN130291 TaxID=3112940 RepID=UPI002E26C7A6